MIAFAERLGITSLTRDDYGLSLTLGGGDVSLIDMTTAYAVFANGGEKRGPQPQARQRHRKVHGDPAGQAGDAPGHIGAKMHGARATPDHIPKDGADAKKVWLIHAGLLAARARAGQGLSQSRW